MTKTTLLAATLVGAMTLPAFAGGMGAPIVEPVMDTAIVIEDMNEPVGSSARNLPRIIFSLLTLVATMS